MTSQSRFAIQDAMADKLLSFSDGLLKKKINKGYIVLEHKIGKSDRNKNAVSFIREGVSFMLSDWAFEEEAKQPPLELQVDRSERFPFPRLIFKKLNLNDLIAHHEFFTRLLKEAVRQSHYLQGQ